jgi:hypothetical protein
MAHMSYDMLCEAVHVEDRGGYAGHDGDFMLTMEPRMVACNAERMPRGTLQDMNAMEAACCT